LGPNARILTLSGKELGQHDHNGCKAAVADLKHAGTDASKTEAALRAIANLSRMCAANRTELVALGACEAVAAALRTFSRNPYVVAQGCYAVCSMALDHEQPGQPSTTSGKGRMVAAGGCELVMETLKVFEEDLEVVNYAARSVVKITIATGEAAALGRSLLMKMGCVSALVACCRSFPSNAELHKWCAWSVGNFAEGMDEATQRQLVVEEAAPFLFASLRAYARNADVVRWVYWGLRNMELIGLPETRDKMVAAKVDVTQLARAIRDSTLTPEAIHCLNKVDVKHLYEWYNNNPSLLPSKGNGGHKSRGILPTPFLFSVITRDYFDIRCEYCDAIFC